ncbi:MAG: insulinase family protein [Acidobacteria bacterium]|nr:insulinase family protein [Acidobacteriota bacterium]
MKYTSLFLISFFLLFAVFAGAELKIEDVKVHQLDNGLRILLLEDHAIPNIALYTYFRVGSRNERPGITGVSHFIEHMMFNGTEKVGPGEFDRIMEFLGGSNNAFTGYDMTGYTDWFPKTALEEMIKIEADRMQGAIFESEVLESERGVVAEERRLVVDNNNESLLEEQVNATAITAHPYHWDVIGWMSDIQNWSRENILEYYHTYYAPNNSLMIVVGDFQEKEIMPLLEKYYDGIKPGPKPKDVTTVEPSQLGPKTVVINKEAQMPYFMMVFHAPKCTDDEFFPVSIIESALMDGESSRLYKRLVRDEKLAVDVSGGLFETIDPFVFSFRIHPKSGVDMKQIETIVLEELEKIKNEGITQRELQKAVNNVKSSFYDELQTIGGKADLLGRAEIYYGDYKKVFERMKKYAVVSLEDIKTAAKKYFTVDQMTTGNLIPTGGE